MTQDAGSSSPTEMDVTDGEAFWVASKPRAESRTMLGDGGGLKRATISPSRNQSQLVVVPLSSPSSASQVTVVSPVK